MKRILLSSLTLLWLCFAQPANAQTLTARQLLDLSKMEQMQKDDYLIKRGWKFDRTEQESDSLHKVFWGFRNSKGNLISEVCAWQQIGELPAFSYSTVLRPAFDAIRTTVVAVPMEVIGTNNTEGLQTFYRDAKFDVILSIRNHQGRTEYDAYFQQHGLTKAYSVSDDGKMVPGWIIVPPMTETQKQRCEAFADSVAQENNRIRASAHLIRVASKKSRK